MQIFVNSAAYDVSSTDSIQAVKAMIQDTTGFPADQMTLTSNGRVLSNMSDVADQSTLHLHELARR